MNTPFSYFLTFLSSQGTHIDPSMGPSPLRVPLTMRFECPSRSHAAQARCPPASGRRLASRLRPLGRPRRYGIPGSGFGGRAQRTSSGGQTQGRPSSVERPAEHPGGWHIESVTTWSLTPPRVRRKGAARGVRSSSGGRPGNALRLDVRPLVAETCSGVPMSARAAARSAAVTRRDGREGRDGPAAAALSLPGQP
jgi:hypothetical protein